MTTAPSRSVRMVPFRLEVDGRRIHYALSDNADAHGPQGPGSPPVWAVNVHGYFAGGRMYARESARLAQCLGWRVVNPSLPGFGGSDPLGWHEVSVGALADQLCHVVDHLEVGPVVLLGHSMGGAVAVRYAHDRPERTLGLVYRAGVATPAWRDRRGFVRTAVSAFSPNAAPLADLVAAFAIEAPGLLLGKPGTLPALLPDVGRNVKTMGLTLPVGAMLMAVDLRAEVGALADAGIPMLAEWGSSDRIVGASAAHEFARWARTTVEWVPGGHAWMLAQPDRQAEVLSGQLSGRRFLADVARRQRTLCSAPRRRGVRSRPGYPAAPAATASAHV